MPAQVVEAGQPAAPRQQFVEQMALRKGEQPVVRCVEPAVVDVQEQPVPLQDLESVQGHGAAAAGRLQHPQLVQDALAAGLQDLPVEVAARRWRALHQHDPHPRPQQHQGEGEPCGARTDDHSVGVQRVRAAGGKGAVDEIEVLAGSLGLVDGLLVEADPVLVLDPGRGLQDRQRVVSEVEERHVEHALVQIPGLLPAHARSRAVRSDRLNGATVASLPACSARSWCLEGCPEG